MRAWCKSVATLDKTSIEIGTSPLVPRAGSEHIWHTNSTFCSTISVSTPEKYRKLQKNLDVYGETIIEQVLKPIKLNRESISDSFSTNKEIPSILDKVAEERYLTKVNDDRKYMKDILLNLQQRLLQLEIGSTSSRFYLKPTTGIVGGYIYVSLRTTEIHVQTKTSSYNGLVLPLQKEEFQAILELYEKYREPRIKIRRCVDILETVSPQGLYPHFLVLSYGHGDDMTHIVRGASEIGNAYLEKSPKGTRELVDIVGSKITPNKLSTLDLEPRG